MTCPCCGSDREPFQDIVVDLNSNRLFVGGREYAVTPRMAEVMEVLIKARGAAIPMDRFVVKVWGATADENCEGDPTKRLHVYAYNLRKVLRPHGWDIAAAWGKGYRLAKLPVT